MESHQRKHVTRQKNNFFVDAIDDAASTAQSPEEFSKILDEKYHIIFKISRNRYSYLHPGRKKYITERNLGTRYTEDFLLKAFEENTKSHREQKKKFWNSRLRILPQIYQLFLSLILLLSLHHSFS